MTDMSLTLSRVLIKSASETLRKLSQMLKYTSRKVRYLVQVNRNGNSQPFTLIIHTYKSIQKRLPCVWTLPPKSERTRICYLKPPIFVNLAAGGNEDAPWFHQNQ